MLTKAEIKRNNKFILFMESEYYNRVLTGWFKAYKRVGGRPELITKKYLLEEAGLFYHQRFNHYFPTLEDLYRKTRMKFRLKMKNVMSRYLHQNARGTDFWKYYLEEVYVCRRECRMAVKRHDILFFIAGLEELWVCLEQSVFDADAGSVVYSRCFYALMGIILGIIKEWDQRDYARGDLESYAKEIARLSYSLNHINTSFSAALGEL